MNDNEKKSERVAVYPGTFDPCTNGHLDIIKRSLKLVDKVIVLIAHNSQKKTLFSLEERKRHIVRIVEDEELGEKVIIDVHDGLIVDYCRDRNIFILIRGLRPLVDFEYEFEMAMTNREMNADIETVFILTDQKYFYLRSSLIKDLVKFGGDVADKVPDIVYKELVNKLKNQGNCI